MKFAVLLSVLVFSGCGLLKDINYHPTAPGYLAVDTTLRDKVRRVALVPASLFDKDDSVSTLRLGFNWKEGMGDNVEFVASVFGSDTVHHVVTKNNTRPLEVVIDDKTYTLDPATTPYRIRSRTRMGGSVKDLDYIYVGSKKILQRMMKANNVHIRLSVLGSNYVGRFDMNNSYRKRYVNNRNYAMNAADRFLKAIP